MDLAILKKVAEKLQKGRKFISDRSRWKQGASGSGIAHGETACSVSSLWEKGQYYDGNAPIDYVFACQYLDKAIDSVHIPFRPPVRSSSQDRVVAMNDSKRNSHEDVLSVFDRAIKDVCADITKMEKENENSTAVASSGTEADL